MQVRISEPTLLLLLTNLSDLAVFIRFPRFLLMALSVHQLKEICHPSAYRAWNWCVSFISILKELLNNIKSNKVT